MPLSTARKGVLALARAKGTSLGCAVVLVLQPEHRRAPVVSEQQRDVIGIAIGPVRIASGPARGADRAPGPAKCVSSVPIDLMRRTMLDFPVAPG
jgi:hypothetical protein